MKTVINSNGAPKAIGPYSQAIKANGFIFVSGQLPIDPKTGELEKCIQSQTRQSLANIKAILESAGSSIDKIVKTNVYIKDMANFDMANEIYTTFFSNVFPARSCVEVSRLPKDAQVEIEVIAIA